MKAGMFLQDKKKGEEAGEAPSLLFGDLIQCLSSLDCLGNPAQICH